MAGMSIPCRCRFREGEPCKFKCNKRVESCEQCGFGGRKFKSVKKLMACRESGKIRRKI